MIPSIEWIDSNKVKMIDQTLLPHELKFLEFENYRDVAKAIKVMNIRGAPAIGVAAAMGMALATIEYEELPKERFLEKMEAADVFIHPSIEESFGMVLIEAMAKKTPVIAGEKSGAVPWVLDYGRAGVLAEIRSPESIATEVINLLSNHKKWEVYSEAGFNYVKENFVISKVVDQYLDEYNRILQN